jgi:alanine racemase
MHSKCIDNSPRLTIDLAAIEYNYYFLKKKYGPSVAAVVLKSDAYGLGCIPISRCLYNIGCNDFFVVHIQDGILLRNSLGSKPNVYVLYGVERGLEYVYLDLNFIPVLNTKEDVFHWVRYADDKGLCLPAVFKINTGMNRLGLSVSDLREISQLDLAKVLDIKYIISHLACGRIESTQNNKQLENFIHVCEKYFPNTSKSIAASNILTLSSEFSMSMVRYGLNLYGAFAPVQLKNNPLIFALRLEAKILQIMEIDEGESLGYDASYIAPHNMRIATLAIGYADGLPLTSSGNFAINIDGELAPIVGAISMNLTTIDITNIKSIYIQQGSWVTIINSNEELYRLAEAANSSLHELVTRFGCIYNKRFLTSQ